MYEDYPELFTRMLFHMLGEELNVQDFHIQSGGDINMAVSVLTNKGKFFIKWNEGQYEEMFETEALGLQLLQQCDSLVIPEVFGFGKVDDKAFLVLEFLESGFEDEAY